MDERLLPLPLAPQFVQLVVGESFPLSDLPAIFLAPGKTLYALHRASQAMQSTTKPVQIEGMDAHAWLAAVGLTFVDPLSQTELVPGGADRDVTPANLAEFVARVLDLWLNHGVAAQVRAFRDGLNDVLPLAKLNLLHVPELLTTLCGDADVVWDAASLDKALKLAHGYTKDSAPVRALVQVLDEMPPPARRAFLLYATGCPNLPPGGLEALRPPFEVVRRVVDSPRDVDRALPFARTCTNTLHLPAYSSKQVLEQQLAFAIANSRGVIDRD